MYKAIAEFVDLQDSNHKYRVGDEFPRPGFEVADVRIEELKSDNNKLKKPLIEEVAEEVEAEQPEEIKAEKPKRGRKKNAD